MDGNIIRKSNLVPPLRRGASRVDPWLEMGGGALRSWAWTTGRSVGSAKGEVSYHRGDGFFSCRGDRCHYFLEGWVLGSREARRALLPTVTRRVLDCAGHTKAWGGDDSSSPQDSRSPLPTRGGSGGSRGPAPRKGGTMLGPIGGEMVFEGTEGRTLFYHRGDGRNPARSASESSPDPLPLPEPHFA